MRELFRSMTPAARVTSGLLLVVVVISLVYLVRTHASGPDAYLMGGEPFPASELPAMEAAFAAANLSDYQVDGNRIRVPRGQNAAYMGALADAGALPANFGDSMRKALDDDGMFLSKQDKLSRLKVATQDELSLILRSMKGIEKASVLYDVQKGRGLSRQDIVTATVSVKPTGNEPLDAARVSTIRNLVAGAIAGLRREQVTVADLNGRAWPGGPDEDGVGEASEDPYYARKRMYEKQLEGDITKTLAYVPGVIVKVNADLDKVIRQVEESIKHDPKTVPVRTREVTSTDKTEGTTPGGRPGLEAQGPSGGAAIIGVARRSMTESDNTETENINYVSSDKTTKELKGFTPERVKVTVIVPTEYYRQVWQAANPGIEGEVPEDPPTKDLVEIEAATKKNVENAVVGLLPAVPAGVDPFPQVTVTSFQSLAQAPIPEPTLAADATSWMSRNWSVLGMTGLALFSLVMLRSMVRGAGPTSPQEGEAEVEADLRIHAAADDTVEEKPARPNTLRREISGPNLKEELSELVREDPDAAAAILRNWINNAA
jgi:flagellar M-ring protein FliF